MTQKAESVRALGERIADYLETSLVYDQWSKRDCAIEAVRIACEDAAHHTLPLVAVDGSGSAVTDEEAQQLAARLRRAAETPTSNPSFSTSRESKVVDLMAALERSVEEAKRARRAAQPTEETTP